MSKIKKIYTCGQCGASTAQWAGQCTTCGAWNSIAEEGQVVAKSTRGYAGVRAADITMLSAVSLETQARYPTHSQEFDRALGGGLVSGSVVLIGGDPGIGKSTLLLQILATLSVELKALYITGEESLQQVSMRANRLGLDANHIAALAETHTEQILKHAQKHKPQVMVIDSIQTLFSDAVTSAPGSVSQVRESAARLVQYAKQNQCALFLVGHVTKEGALAGPRVLEHMVDTVLYFEGQGSSRFRALRAIKNRFGAVNELGVFAMTDKGVREVSNPSAMFLSNYETQVAGSCVMTTWEGSRPLLIEVQALVDDSHAPQPRRVTVGLEHNRLAMLLAVLHRHGGIATYDQDVFVNVVGGVRVTETAADLALVSAVISSLRNQAITHKMIAFGEIGLAGEIRPVQSGPERLNEAVKHGFTHAIIPQANAPKKPIEGMTVYPVKTLSEALGYLN